MLSMLFLHLCSLTLASKVASTVTFPADVVMRSMQVHEPLDQASTPYAQALAMTDLFCVCRWHPCRATLIKEFSIASGSCLL